VSTPRLDLRLDPFHPLRQGLDLGFDAIGQSIDRTRHVIDALAESLDLRVDPGLALARRLPISFHRLDQSIDRLLDAPEARWKLQKLFAEQDLQEEAPELGIFPDPPDQLLRQAIGCHARMLLPSLLSARTNSPAQATRIPNRA
jgi:hypothetical protein